MTQSITQHRIRFVVCYYIKYEKFAYEYYEEILEKVNSKDTSQDEKEAIIKRYSPYEESDSIYNIIYNILQFCIINLNKIFKFITRWSQLFVVYCRNNVYKIRNTILKKCVNDTVKFIDMDKKTTEKKTLNVQDQHQNYVEIITWTISNFDKNYYLLLLRYPHLKYEWTPEQRKFLKVYRVYSFIYEDVSNPQNNLYNDALFYEEV